MSMLSKVFASGPGAKLLPLLLERALRTLDERCPADALASASGRRSWAAAQGLRWSPRSARRPQAQAWFAVVDWEPCAPDAPSLHGLPAAGLRARLALTFRCRLLQEDAGRPAKLRLALADMAERCPPAIRREPAALRQWAREHSWSYVPCHVDSSGAATSSKQRFVCILWADSRSGKQVEELRLKVPVAVVARFGPPLASGKAPQRQLKLSKFFTARPTAAEASAGHATVAADPAAEAAAGAEPSTPRRPRKRAARDAATPPRRPKPGAKAADPLAEQLCTSAGSPAKRRRGGSAGRASPAPAAAPFAGAPPGASPVASPGAASIPAAAADLELPAAPSTPPRRALKRISSDAATPPRRPRASTRLPREDLGGAAKQPSPADKELPSGVAGAPPEAGPAAELGRSTSGRRPRWARGVLHQPGSQGGGTASIDLAALQRPECA